MRPLALLLLLSACETLPPPPPPPPTPEQLLQREFPDVTALYGGDHGIYRGCGPNGGVCHNSRQYPALSSLAQLVQNIGQPCNLLRDRARDVDHLCERAGDSIRAGDHTYRIGYFTALSTDSPALSWKVTLGEPVVSGDAAQPLSIVRPADGAELVLYDLSGVGVTAAEIPDEPRALALTLPDPGLVPALTDAGIPARLDVIRVWDPNQDGRFGVEEGGALIKPGDPAKSYVIKRLIDPTAGSVMPLANCCFWTKPALRALWCWIDGLAADGANAMAPIAYAGCRPGPVENIAYPEPGPTCEMDRPICPVQPRTLTTDPTWANVYENVLRLRCAGSGCHTDVAAGGLDLSSEAQAFTTLSAGRVMARHPDQSRLWQRLTASDSSRMPLGRPALPQAELDVIRRWIEAGALHQ